MIRILPYFFSLSLILGLSSTTAIHAGIFSKCDSRLGKEGGPEARKCVASANPEEDPNFFDSFIKNHCHPVTDKWNLRPCQDAINKIKEKNERQKLKQ